ncbi:hypothetical protein DM806_08295 [Sphingobium lactosutens]|uniref:hemerythrin domain-containing protein n=1 Tax=Sphingobium lactosutens TaxID=522773 RepID=UPI0015B8A951|nr:hemerythrin domain-containing protein [Sphingobium lactosutens]NWK95672.1 hypothetical protein [Sphingobium lactosutens]
MVMVLRQDHDGLRLLMREFAQLLAVASIRDMPDLARRRIAFSQAFREHMGREDAMVRDLGRRSPTPQATGVVREHGRAMVALFLRYSDHVKDWAPAQINADLAGYRNAVRALQNGFHDRMAWEEQHLHPLLEGPTLRAA